MVITFEFYGTLRDAAGAKTAVRDFERGTTIGEAMAALGDDYPDLGPLLLRSDGRVRPNVTVAIDGDAVPDDDREGRSLADGETLVPAPGIAGGQRGPAR